MFKLDKNQFLQAVYQSFLLTVTSVIIPGQNAIAGTFYQGWNYSIDALEDGSGGFNFDMTGIAIKETPENLLIALTGGMPLGGVAATGAIDGNIGWGDLFLNFTGQDFPSANQAQNLYAIRFAASNDSQAISTGLYGDVSALSVAERNNGYDSLESYYQAGYYQPQTLGTDFPTQQTAYDYLGANFNLNAIASGHKLGEITFLSPETLLAEHLNFAEFGASGLYTIGFQLEKTLLPSGNYIANIFLECLNDGVALTGTLSPTEPPPTTPVPEPSTLGAIAFFALPWLRRWLRNA